MSDDGKQTADQGSPVAPGDVLAGKYRIDQILGAGGMGVVVAATHLELNDKVAVKFLLPHALKNEEATARFVREARAAVRIKGEHVARVIDVGRLDNDAPYMVMEYLDGHDLGQASVKGPLPIEEAVDYVLQACDAMAEVHAAGIIHRDLKPANLFRTERADGSGLIKVLDFGISKVADPTMKEAGLTRTSTAMGSPLYMSPEQLRSAKDVDTRADIWSLGAILFELLSTKTPFDAESFPELCAEILESAPRSLRGFRPDLPVELERVVVRCLQKEPSARPQNVAELAALLVPFAPEHAKRYAERTRRVLARAGMPSIADPDVRAGAEGIAAASGGVHNTAANWADTRPEARQRSRAALWVASGAVLVAIVVGALMLGRSTAEPDANGSPAAEPAPTEPIAAATNPAAAETIPPVTPSPMPSASVTAPVARDTTTRREEPPARTKEAAREAKSKTKEPTIEKPPEEPAEAPKTAPLPPPPPPKKNPLDIGLK